MNKYDNFIKRFTSDFRAWSEEPRQKDGQVYGTDGKVMARVAEHLCEASYSEHENQPNFGRCFPAHTCTLSMDIRKVAKAIGTVPVEEFKDWFFWKQRNKKDATFNGVIVHFTPLRYAQGSATLTNNV